MSSLSDLNSAQQSGDTNPKVYQAQEKIMEISRMLSGQPAPTPQSQQPMQPAIIQNQSLPPASAPQNSLPPNVSEMLKKRQQSRQH